MLNLDHQIFPQLNTTRLILRSIVAGDAPRIHLLRFDPEINRYINRPKSGGIDDAVKFIDQIKGLTATEGRYWIITLKDDNELIGTVCLWNFDLLNNSVEIGYELMTSYQGKGIMTEAVQKVIEYCFDQLNAKMITACPSADNERSVALLKRFEFLISDQLKPDFEQDNENVLVYTLSRN